MPIKHSYLLRTTNFYSVTFNFDEVMPYSVWPPPPSTETHAGWSHLIWHWHNFVTVGDSWILMRTGWSRLIWHNFIKVCCYQTFIVNWIKIRSLAYIGTHNRNAPGSESSRERNFQGAKVPYHGTGSESFQRLWSHPTCWRYINKIIIIIKLLLYAFLVIIIIRNARNCNLLIIRSRCRADKNACSTRNWFRCRAAGVHPHSTRSNQTACTSASPRFGAL